MKKPGESVIGLLVVFAVFAIFSAVLFWLFTDTAMDLHFQKDTYQFYKPMEGGPSEDFTLYSGYTDAIELPKKGKLTITCTAVFTEDYTGGLPNEQVSMLLSTVPELADETGNYIEYGAFLHSRHYWNGSEAEHAITRESVTKDKPTTIGYDGNLEAGKQYKIRIEIERAGNRMLVSRFVDDGETKKELPSFWHSYDWLPVGLYARIGGRSCTLYDVKVEDSYITRISTEAKHVWIAIWGIVGAIVLGITAGVIQSGHGESSINRHTMICSSIPAFVLFVLVSQFFTERIVEFANDIIRKKLSINIFPSFPLRITFPARGSTFYWGSLIVFGLLLLYMLYLVVFSADSPFKSFFVWLVLAVLYTVILYVFFSCVTALLNELLPLGVLLLFCGMMGAGSGSGSGSTPGAEREFSRCYYVDGPGWQDTVWYYASNDGNTIRLVSEDGTKDIFVTKGMNYETDGYLYGSDSTPFRPG